MISALAIAIGLSTAGSVFYYWATAQNKGLKLAYISAIGNGLILIWINWRLGLGDTTIAVNLFSLLSFWIIYSGIKGLVRLREERRRSSEG